MGTVDNDPSGATLKDHFSGHSGSYAEYRPSYPDALFRFLADCCSRHELAWDCATGNGQAARTLAAHFRQVIATDASEAQIELAQSRPNIEYRVAKAETFGLSGQSVDLITVAQAMHWFDIPAFWAEAQRVLTRGGVLAIWSYANCHVDAECDTLINELYGDIVGPYWPAERKIVQDGYGSIELPMSSVSTPEFAMKADWDIGAMLGYLRTWSASQRYLNDRATDPVSLIEERLRAAWGGGIREVSWPLNIKIGRA